MAPRRPSTQPTEDRGGPDLGHRSVPNGPALWAKMRARHRYDCKRERAPASLPAQSLRTYWPGCCSGCLCAEEVRFHKGM
eukprot:scaffold9354_cov108-Isochrysis_galbana.AAC.1